MPDKGPGTKARLPRAPGKGRRRVQGTVLSHPGAAAALTSRACRVPVSIRPCPGWGTVRYQVGRAWHWCCATPATGPLPALLWCEALMQPPNPALPTSRCSGAEMGCRGAKGYGDGAESMGWDHSRGWQISHMSLQSRCASVSPAATGGVVNVPCFPTIPLPTATFVPTPPSRLQSPCLGAAATAQGQERHRRCRVQLGLCPPTESRGASGHDAKRCWIPQGKGLGMAPVERYPGGGH